MITIKVEAGNAEIKMEGQRVDVPQRNLPEMLEALAKQAPGQVRVIITKNLDRDSLNKAKELAGLSSFQAAQQIAKGYIEF